MLCEFLEEYRDEILKLSEEKTKTLAGIRGGIDKNKIGRLFDPYVQASADRSGLGLGLSITQRAIQLSQGQVSVENLEGTGCIFRHADQSCWSDPELENRPKHRD